MANRKLTITEATIALAELLARKKAYLEAADLDRFLAAAVRGESEGISGACDISYVKGQADLLEELIEGFQKEWPTTVEKFERTRGCA